MLYKYLLYFIPFGVLIRKYLYIYIIYTYFFAFKLFKSMDDPWSLY